MSKTAYPSASVGQLFWILAGIRQDILKLFKRGIPLHGDSDIQVSELHNLFQILYGMVRDFPRKGYYEQPRVSCISNGISVRAGRSNGCNGDGERASWFIDG